MKIGILVQEFFDSDLGGFGGYGFLARHYLAHYLPKYTVNNKSIIGYNEDYKPKEIVRDNKHVLLLPNKFGKNYNLDILFKYKAHKFLKEEKFDLYLSIEYPFILTDVLKCDKNNKLIFWIQDPRPLSDWEEIKTLKMGNEYKFFNPKFDNLKSTFINELIKEDRIKFVTQAKFLIPKAKELYNLPDSINIDFLPNPIDIKENLVKNTDSVRKNITFLGRLDPVKRPWIFFEIAKKMPNYNFNVCGQSHVKEYMEPILNEYKDVPNLFFLGNVTGEKKDEILTKTDLLVNTSIHEALPVSFLEALSYKIPIVSCQNPDDITEKYGHYVGQVLGEGYHAVDDFCNGIERLLQDDEIYSLKAETGYKYVKETHSIDNVMQKLTKYCGEIINE